MQTLLKNIRSCRVCAQHLPLGCNPIISANPKSRILLISQAPGRIVHNNNVAWTDKSGHNLRNWLGVDENTFYDTNNFAVLPMGFCFPGTGKSGDLPPRPECAPLWHADVLLEMKDVQLVLLIGQYAQKYYLGKTRKKNLTETVAHFEEYLPKFFPLPHPSPRNNIWQRKNSWFAESVLPVLKQKIERFL